MWPFTKPKIPTTADVIMRDYVDVRRKLYEAEKTLTRAACSVDMLNSELLRIEALMEHYTLSVDIHDVERHSFSGSVENSKHINVYNNVNVDPTYDKPPYRTQPFVQGGNHFAEDGAEKW